MNVLVDTSIWSLALRRSKIVVNVEMIELRRLIDDFEAAIIGPIRQELLSGIRDIKQFVFLRERLAAFPDLALKTADFEQAASYFNHCRVKGVQGSNTDFLICAVSSSRKMPIFTTDGDFAQFAKLLPIKLHRMAHR